MGLISILGKVNIKYVVLAGMLVYFGFVVYSLKVTISTLEEQVIVLTEYNRKATAEIATRVVENEMLKMSIDTQNKAIEKMAIDADADRELYDNWVAKPAEIRYKEVYTYIPSKVGLVGMDECTRLKTMNKAISRIKYEDL